MFFVMSRGDRLWYYYLKKIFTPPYLRFSRATYRAVTKTYPCPVVVQYRTLLQSRSSAMIPTADKDYLPLFVEGKVVKGFGRGSKQLGIPTANFDEDIVRKLPEKLENGVYYGFANIDAGDVYKMVLSVGLNPHFHNKLKTMETHILHQFDSDFYNSTLRVAVLGYIRPMRSFSSMDELITAIKDDISQSESQLDRPEIRKYEKDEFFHRPLLPSNGHSMKMETTSKSPVQNADCTSSTESNGVNGSVHSTNLERN